MEEIASQIVAWLRNYAQAAGAQGYVVGLSGGIDSAVAAALCQQAVGDNVLGVMMPCYSAPDDGEMARLVARALNLQTISVDLTATYETMVQALSAAAPPGPSDLARANIKPRLRMTTLYAFAQTLGYLVAGTGNRSEIQVGYFTKYGDGGVDLEPLGELYKWQVRQLARHLGIPELVITRPPTAGLWAGQTDEQEMGITYDDLDRALAAMEAGNTPGLEPALLDRVQRMVSASAHKRAMPPVCPLNMGLLAAN